MSVELDVLDVDTVGGADFFNFDPIDEKSEFQSNRFPESIFVPPYYPTQFSSKAALDLQSQESLKTDALVRNHLEIKSVKLGSNNNDRGYADKDFLLMCGHKEEASIKHETDDNGNSRTRVDAGATYNKGDYYIEGKVWVEDSNENGKSKTECGGEAKCGKRF